MPVMRGLRNALPDFIFYRLRYFIKNGSLPNLRMPQKFSEKITWRMRNPHPEFTTLADKYLARSYITAKVGDRYLPKLYLATKELTECQFASLPDRFVMKSNHACGDVIRIDDKSGESYTALRDAGRQWLARNFASVHREKQYERIPRILIFEEFLGEKDEFYLNYRVHCFRDDRGEFFAFCQFAAGPHSGVHLANWAVADFKVKGSRPFDPTVEMPECWPEALMVAEKLLGDHPYMRVDLYLIRDKIFVGELTLTPSAGRYRFDPPEYDIILGERYGKEKVLESK